LIESPGCKIELLSKVHCCKSFLCARRTAREPASPSSQDGNALAGRTGVRAQPTFPLPERVPETLDCKSSSSLASKTAEPTSGIRSIARRPQSHSQIYEAKVLTAMDGFRFCCGAQGPLLEP
jgi:hypothetical protein